MKFVGQKSELGPVKKQRSIDIQTSLKTKGISPLFRSPDCSSLVHLYTPNGIHVTTIFCAYLSKYNDYFW